jgi:phenylpropionate dioxygenase-like ring-hydroxylating dioxygenase large terminal subunit
MPHRSDMGYRYPFPPYPTGWYRVLSSGELARGQVRTLRYLGRELVAFRDAAGTAAVLDAHCPHLGAHLGQGCVRGDAIECPFHGWRYDASGACVHAGGLVKIPPRARARAWPLTEVNGAIMIWHDAGGRAPTWQVPVIAELNEPGWHVAAGPRWPSIRSHVVELLENGMDLTHFSHLHRQQTLSAETLSVETIGHELVHRTYQRYNLFALAKLWVGEVGGPLDVHLWGLGLAVNRTVVHARIDLRYSFAFYFTPVDDEHVEVTSTLAIERQPSWLATRALLYKAWRETRRTIDQDVPIWEHKVYRSQPALGDGDGPISVFRRWSRQFYESADGAAVEASAAAAPA